MKPRTTNTSYTALAAGIMSVITVFGGITVFLGVLFALFGVFAGVRGRRSEPTAAAGWAVTVSVLGLLLTLAVSAVYIGLYVCGTVTPELNFTPTDLYEKGKELLIRLIEKI